MHILFIHQSFPGQFQYIARYFGALKHTSTLFLAERQRREVKIAGVRPLLVGSPKAVENADPAEREMLLSLRRGACTANAMLRIQRQGFKPDIVCASSGGGHALYVGDIFPDAFRAVYADWFYTKGENYTFFAEGKARPPADFAPARARNWCQFNTLSDCDFAFTFTQWQKEQFPACLAKSIHVLAQGVDTKFFSPSPEREPLRDCDLPPHAELVTFAGRSLEAFRGFGQFVKSIPAILAARPQCHIVIMAGATDAGKEKSPLPEVLPSLSALTKEEQARVHFLGFRPYAEYRALLRASTVHVYLTAPFALSSGLFEAMSCGCLVVGSDTDPVREIIRHGENGFLCDFWDADALARTVSGLLERARLMEPLCQAARNTILNQYDIQQQGPQQVQRLLNSYERWKAAR
ncbi:MAG: glycosyltransferase [Desulfovibrionaceae bacterium]